MKEYQERIIPTYQSEIEALQDIASLIHESAVYLGKVIHFQFAVLVAITITLTWIIKRGTKS